MRHHLPGALRCAALPARSTAALLLLSLTLACAGSDGGAPAGPDVKTPATITRSAGDAQQATVAMAVAAEPTVVVRDAGGNGVAGVDVTFSVTGGGGWVTRHTVTTDNGGAAATTWYLGPAPGAQHRLRAQAGALQAEFTATATALTPGASYLGANGYVEFIAGDIPFIVSAPHGGSLRPAALPDRAGNVTTARDTNTEEMAREMIEQFRARNVGTPHTIIMRLHRLKVDANRDSAEATLGNPQAWRAWREFQGFIEAARAAVVASQRPGFYIDLHGHGHDIPRLELGYLLSSNDLAQGDAALNAPAMVQKSSMRAHVNRTGQPLAEALRGPRGLGTLFETNGFPSVPSQQQPHPAGAPYFTGGYNTARHASADGQLITGLQIEANFRGVREFESDRRRFADALIEVVRAWDPTLLPAAAGAGLQAPH
jgi:hypothetical protein